MNRCISRRKALLGVVAITQAPFTLAQTYPAQPITILVSYPAGGAADTHMRSLARLAEKKLGQPIVIENRPGAAGLLGPNALATAKPDGYTLAQVSQQHFRAPAIGKVAYDPLSFTFIQGFADSPLGIFVAAESPYRGLRELLTGSRKSAGGLNIGTTGVTSSGHMIVATLQKTGSKLVHVPFKGGPDMGVALAGGHLDAAITPVSEGIKLGSKVRMLATFADRRALQAPEVKTAREQGVDIALNVAVGLVGPKGLGPDVVSVLSEAFAAASADPAHESLQHQLGMVPWRKGPAEFAAWARDAVVLEKRLVEAAGITISN